jgi:outer membrane protein TolC
MKYRVLSGLLLCSLLVWNASGQTPPQKVKEKPVEKPVEKLKEVPVKPKPLSVEEIIQRASLSDPEVRIAEAEYQLTKAKLDGLRQNAVKKLMNQRAELEEGLAQVKRFNQLRANQEHELVQAMEELKRAEKLSKEGVASTNDLNIATRKLSTSRAALDQANMNLEAAQANYERLERAFKRVLDSIPGPAKPTTEKKGQPSPPTSIEERIQQASATDQDVKIGQAEVQLSQAKVYAAQVAAVQKLSGQYAAIEATEAEMSALKDQLKSKSEITETFRENLNTLKSNPNASRFEINNVQVAVAQAEGERVPIVSKLMALDSKLSRLKADWSRVEARAMTVPSGPGIDITWLADELLTERDKGLRMQAALQERTAQAERLLIQTMSERDSAMLRAIASKLQDAKPAVEPVPGSPIDKLKQGLGRKIGFRKIEMNWGEFTQEILQRCATDIVVRYDMSGDSAKTSETKVTIPEAELTLYEWLQFIADTNINDQGFRVFDFYVRDYGLAFMKTSSAPRNAVLLSDFWKQVQAEHKPAPPVVENVKAPPTPAPPVIEKKK